MAQVSEMLTFEEVSSKVGVKRTALYSYINKRGFPKPVKISRRCVRWFADEVDQWLRELPRSNGKAEVSA